MITHKTLVPSSHPLCVRSVCGFWGHCYFQMFHHIFHTFPPQQEDCVEWTLLVVYFHAFHLPHTFSSIFCEILIVHNWGKNSELEGCPNYLRTLQIILNSEVSKNDCSGWEEEEVEEVYKLGLCATLLAPSSIDAWRTIWGVGVQPSPKYVL